MNAPARVVALATTLALTTSCTLTDGNDNDDRSAQDRVVLVTHESFSMPERLRRDFEDKSGYELEVRAVGNAGTLTNMLVLTEGDPIGDVVFGIDNTFGSRAIEEGVVAPYVARLPDGAEGYRLPGDDDHRLTPVDTGSVCVNIDKGWFARRGMAEPETLDDLAHPDYEGMFVTPGATISSAGLAFLLATIAAYGPDGWQSYWRRLLDNGAKVTQGWTDAYQVDFTQGGGRGDRPIVLSYDSSPAITLDGSGGTTTRALLQTCFRQIEYAGVLNGAANAAGGEALVDFMLGREFQESLPSEMYVFPIDPEAELPPDWARFARQPAETLAVAPDDIAAHRDAWLREWTDLVAE